MNGAGLQEGKCRSPARSATDSRDRTVRAWEQRCSARGEAWMSGVCSGRAAEWVDRVRWETIRQRGRREGRSRAVCQRQTGRSGPGHGHRDVTCSGPAESPMHLAGDRAQVHLLDLLWGKLRPWRRDCGPGQLAGLAADATTVPPSTRLTPPAAASSRSRAHSPKKGQRPHVLLFRLLRICSHWPGPGAKATGSILM